MTSKGVSFIEKSFFRGHPNVLRNRTGHKLELNDINCENWIKLRGEKPFGGEKSPLNPP